MNTEADRSDRTGAPTWCLLIALASAGAVAQRAAATPQAPAARLESIEGDAIRGVLERIGQDGSATIRLESGDERSVALDTLFRIDLRPADEVPPTLDGSRDRLWLRSRQVLAATFVSGDRTGGSFSLPYASKPLVIPWRYLQAVRFDLGKDAPEPGFLERAQDPPDGTDFLYALQNDTVRRLSVQFMGIRGDNASVVYRGQERPIPLSRVYGVVFGQASGTRADGQRNPLVSLRLRDGHGIAGKLVDLDDKVLRLRIDEGNTVTIPRTKLHSIHVRSDKLVYLTELTPVVDQTPAFDRVWPWLKNHGPGGDQIRMAGQAYSRGVVLVPRTRLTYGLDARYDVFEAVIGMEDSAGKRAHAVFRILGDGKVLLDTGPITRDTAPQTVKLPVAQVKKLTLEADFGKDFDLGDMCVFAMPRVLRN